REGLWRVEAAAASKTGVVIGLKGRFAEARRSFTRALERIGDDDPRQRGIVLKDLANVLSEEGKNDEAMIELARARDLVRRAGDVREEGFVLMMLGTRLLDVGRLADARRDLSAALGLLRRAADRRTEAFTRVMLALADAEEGALGDARERLED